MHLHINSCPFGNVKEKTIFRNYTTLNCMFICKFFCMVVHRSYKGASLLIGVVWLYQYTCHFVLFLNIVTESADGVDKSCTYLIINSLVLDMICDQPLIHPTLATDSL